MGRCDGQPLMLDDIEKDLPANSSKLLTESKWTFITQEIFGVSMVVKVESLDSFAHLCSQSDECLLLQLLAKFPSILVALYINNQDIRLAAMSCIEGLFKVWPCVTLSGRNNGTDFNLMLLSLLKGVGSEFMLVEEVELLLNELLNRRHQFHLGNDQLWLWNPIYGVVQDEAYVDCIEKGPDVPMRDATGNGASVPKPQAECDMFDNIINCKTTKDVGDTIQVICDGTEQVRENKIQLLIQQYEHFHSEEVSLRNSQYYKEFTLDRLYGILKTYKIEIEQDEKMEKRRKKGASIALVVEQEKEKEIKVEVVESAPNLRVCEGKGKGLVAEHKDQLSQDDMDDIDENLAFLSRRFSKLKSRRILEQPSQTETCECRKPDSGKKKFEDVDYKHKYFELLKKKERDFITQENDWVADGLEEVEETNYVNLALMAKSNETETSSSSNQVITTNLAHLSKAECNDAINDMSTELYHLRVTPKSLTEENNKIKENNVFLSERNNVLETRFVEFEKLKIECKIAKDELTESLKKEEILRKQLEREQEVIKAWNLSRDVHSQITKVQGMESFCDVAWIKNKEKLDSNLVEGLSTDVDSTDDENYPSNNQKDYSSKDNEPHPLSASKPVRKAKLAKLNEKYGSVSKNFVPGEEVK
ncbi:hypothetical protein AgCh_006137 [Apium graveolens]